jgi:hypothetical protein
MCRPATCRTCGKATYSGCGEHVEKVLRDVPASERCRCDSRPARTGSTEARPGTKLGRIFGR